MPTAPSYPGVYVEEVSSGVHTITGVATSIAAFFGRTAKGPINKAVRCTSLSDFYRGFGGAHASSDLEASVRQFYDNGGSDCYVVRLAHNARKADVTLKNMAGTKNVLTARAKNAGAWGNGVSLEVDYNTPNPDETFNLRVIQEERGVAVLVEEFANLTMDPSSARFAPEFVSQSSTLIELQLAAGFVIASEPVLAGYSECRRALPTSPVTDFRTALNSLVYPSIGTPRSAFEISINNGPYIAVDLRADPTDTEFTGTVAAIGTEINTRINEQIKASDASLKVVCSFETVDTNVVVLRIVSDCGDKQSIHIRRSSVKDLAAALMMGIDQGGIEIVRYSNFRPVPTATVLTGAINDLAKKRQDAFNQITVGGFACALGTDLQTVAVDRKWYEDGLPASVSGNRDGVREKLRIIAKKINAQSASPCRAEVWGYHLALIPVVGSVNASVAVTTGNSGGGGDDISSLFTVNTRRYTLGPAGTSAFQSGAGIEGKDDDGNPPDANDYTGSEADQTGFHALDSVDLFNLMILPADKDVDRGPIWGQASIYCQQHRAFLIIDAPDSWTGVTDKRPKATSVEINDLRSKVIKDYSAVFYPGIVYAKNGVKKAMGASGIIAGLMARTDAARGVWKAPAGTEADLRGILDVEVNLTDRENGVYNKLGVNCIRSFASGIVNWGARTLDGSDDIGSEWKYIPIRRLALFLEESLYRGTKWIVFEPNDEPLWAKIRLNLRSFMTTLFRQGAFQGATPDQAFYVKCDGETTTQADRDRGIVNIEVGFAPLKPAEFVIIRFQQIAGKL